MKTWYFWKFKFELRPFDVNIINICKLELWDNLMTTINNVSPAEVLGNQSSTTCRGRHFAFACHCQTCFGTGMKRTPVLLLISLWICVPLRTGTIYTLLANNKWSHLLTMQLSAQKLSTTLLLIFKLIKSWPNTMIRREHWDLCTEGAWSKCIRMYVCYYHNRKPNCPIQFNVPLDIISLLLLELLGLHNVSGWLCGDPRPSDPELHIRFLMRHKCVVLPHAFMWKRKSVMFQKWCVLFLGAFTKVRKATISSVMSIRLSAHVEKLGSHSTDFHNILCLRIFFANLSR